MTIFTRVPGNLEITLALNTTVFWNYLRSSLSDIVTQSIRLFGISESLIAVLSSLHGTREFCQIWAPASVPPNKERNHLILILSTHQGLGFRV